MAMKTAIKKGEKLFMTTENGKKIQISIDLKTFSTTKPTFYVVIEAPREIEIRREGHERRDQ